jgi:transaldolase
MNPTRALGDHGQALWLDYFDRGLLSAELERLIKVDGLKGLTSNPAIFKQAMADAHQYDRDIRERAREASSAKELYELLAVRDMRLAADIFRPLYERTAGWDGWVSLEVDPRLAYDTAGSVREARWLWRLLSRPNVFIKIPATNEGLPVIEQLISEGVNVNVTLVFGLPRYRQVANAFMSGLEQRVNRGEPIGQVRSVASFFLSRIDSMIDPLLQQLAREGGDRGRLAKQLYGEIALASAKTAYQIYREFVGMPRWRSLSTRGARAQWLLWGSTSVKNPSFDELKYVDALIGPETINTMPPSTLNAYRERGVPERRLTEGVERAQVILEQVAQLDVSLDAISAKLETQGVEKFRRPFEELLAKVAQALEAA